MRYTATRQLAAISLILGLSACGGGGGGAGGSTGGTPPPVNKAPTISGTPSGSINVGEAYSFMPTASDPDGDTLRFSVTNLPPWASFDESTGTLSGAPTAGSIGAFDSVGISVSDGQLSASLAPFAIAVMPEILGRNNFNPKGDVFPVAGGYQSVGDLELRTAEFSQEFKNGDLVVTFDGDDKLDIFYGETDVPGVVSPTTTVNGTVRAVVETMTGRQINEDTDFGIRLIEDTKYFVFYIGAAFDMTTTDRQNPQEQETITIDTPYGGQALLIMDPTDTFLYHYGSTPIAGAGGYGESDHGLIPFAPELEFAELDSFNGHEINTGAMGLGVKYVDVLEISGTRVIKNPQFADINWDDIFESDIEYRAGINGDLNFALSILGFGLFSFDLAEASATIDVGFDRQHMAMSLRIAPDSALFPEPYGIDLATESTGNAYLNGDGEYGFFLDSAWQTQLPAATIDGTVIVENGAAELQGTVGEGEDALVVSLAFANDETVGTVEFPESYSSNINNSVSASLDRRIAEVEQLIADLEQATADYEFEVSLRGLREALPAMADAAIRTLNGIPDTARRDAEDDALDYMASTCVTVLRKSVCLDDVVDEDSIADSAGDVAFNESRDAIAAPKAAMQELKRRAQEADDASLRAALKAALDSAYDNRSVRIQASYAYSFGTPFNKRYTVYSRNSTEKVLSTADADRINSAANNVHRIQATSDIMIGISDILDQLPTSEAIGALKAEVDAGTANVPAVGGLGYRARANSYSAFVIIDGETVVTDINVLSPADVRSGVSDLLADGLLDTIGN